MTPRFKVGDRVRIMRANRAHLGKATTIRSIDPCADCALYLHRLADIRGVWFEDELELAPAPLSPQARVVFHVMRAGALKYSDCRDFFGAGQRRRRYATADGVIDLTIVTQSEVTSA